MQNTGRQLIFKHVMSVYHHYTCILYLDSQHIHVYMYFVHLETSPISDYFMFNAKNVGTPNVNLGHSIGRQCSFSSNKNIYNVYCYICILFYSLR